MNTSFRFAIIVILLVGAARSPAQQLKIGFVNSAKILEEYPEAQDAKKKLEAFGKRIQDSLEVMSSSYQAKLQEYQQKQSLMNEAAKQSAQRELLDVEQRIIDYRDRKLGREGEYAKYQDKVLGPIIEKAKKVIEDVAREEKLAFVFDKTETAQLLLYGDAKHDYTYKVIDKLKRTR